MRDLLDQVERTMSTLPPDQREALELREIECLDYQEIANRLGVPLGTVRSRINRARSRMRASGEDFEFAAR